MFNPMLRFIKFLDSFGNIVYRHKFKLTNNDLINDADMLSKICKCYPPNIVEIHGNRVFYYHGLEEGLMSWDSIDIRKLKKEIRRELKRNS